MADSKLVTYENYTSHYDSRNGRKITKIFVHHMAGIMTVKDCGRVFKTREASAHYGIDASGAVGQYVKEKHRAWSVASAYYDSMAISIELANSTGSPTWKVSDTAISKCIDLIVDICKRNGIKKINYTGDLSGNLCMHQWVISTACVPTHSEVLTRNGWKRIDEVHEGDEIMCADLNGLNLFFDEVYHKVPVKMQDTYECRGLIATKDHRLVYRTQKDQDYRIDFYANLLQKKDTNHIYIPLAGEFNGEGLHITDDMLKFLIAVQADGHYMYEETMSGKSYYGLEFHLKKQRKIERIKDILDSLNLEYKENFKSDGSVSTRVYNTDEINIVEDLCEKYLDGKKFTWDWINLSKEQADLFLDEILLWDGCVSAQKYSSRERQNLDIVNAIAALNNRGSKVIGSDVFFKNAPYLQLCGKETRKTSDKQREVTCVSVRSGMFLVRQNGKTFVIGNCPGPYLKTKFSYIAQQVNKKLGASVKPNATIKAGQKWLGTEQDGIVSGQSYYDAEYIPALESCTEWGEGGSNFIRALQKKLNTSIRAGLEEDGYCGKKTVTALQTFLKKAGYSIEADGYWGSKTMTAFGKYLANPKEIVTELYYVRKSFDDKKSQKGAFSVKQNAINLCNKYVGYHVYDSKGTLIHTSTKKDEGTAQKFLNELESMEVDMRKLGFKYSNTGSKLGSTWADAKKKKYTNCATYTSWALQEIGVLAKGDLFYCKNHKVNNQRGNAVTNLKKHASISYPNKAPKSCGLKPGDICGYTTHTQTFAGWDKNGNPLWYTMGGSDIGKNLPRVRSDYSNRKIEVLIRLK